MIRFFLLAWLAMRPAMGADSWPGQTSADWSLSNYRFVSGETMPVLKLHYTTLGQPQRDASGAITNAVLLLHGTSGTGTNWLQKSFADEMYGPGQPLDLGQYYVILPDGIGRGGSSKPSDGLRARFPHYRYADMVDLQHRLVTEHLGVKHLRLVLGGSMGGMQTWMWAGLYPDMMDVAVPMASQPIRVSGRNWINRRIVIESIRSDPGWQNGDYTTPPTLWAVTSPYAVMTSANVQALQKAAPDVAMGDTIYRKLVAASRKRDANDVLYATEAVMDYAPEALIPKIRAHLVAINSADDQVNPPELHTTEPAIARIPGARFVLIPASLQTHGHLTYEQAALWKNELVEALAGR